MKVIFLDIDGVLNGYNKWTGRIYKIFNKLHIMWIINKHYDLFGVRTKMVKRLKKIINKTGAYVVISSSWRNQWYKPYDKKNKRIGALHVKFERYDINVIGITDKINGNRNDEILSYIRNHPQITNYVVIDDESFNFSDEILAHFVRTSNTNNITGAWYENTGLRNHHVKEAINILNRKETR